MRLRGRSQAALLALSLAPAEEPTSNSVDQQTKGFIVITRWAGSPFSSIASCLALASCGAWGST